MIQFFAPDIEQTLTLPESDSGHCIRVLRMHTGDTLQVVDGQGNVFTCRLLDENSRHASVEIIEKSTTDRVWSNKISILVAPTKSADRMEWLVEKLTEIGVNRIVPVRCERSERRNVNRERLEKIAVAAMKQSLKAHMPEISEMVPLSVALRDCTEVQRFVGYCDDKIERKLLATSYAPDTDTAILIGPEGDFTAEEIRQAMSSGFLPVTMGNNRLRTETAALVACDTCHIVNQIAQKVQTG